MAQSDTPFRYYTSTHTQVDPMKYQKNPKEESQLFHRALQVRSPRRYKAYIREMTVQLIQDKFRSRDDGSKAGPHRV